MTVKIPGSSVVPPPEPTAPVAEAGRAATPLRVPPPRPPFHVVLVEPEIPPNTGNVARLCAATSSPLHLVGTLGFRIDDHAVRRAGLDYWHLVDVRRHLDWSHFLHAYRKERPDGRCWMFAARGSRSWFDADVDVRLGDALVFGRESVGLPDVMLDADPEHVVALPTSGGVRSHNLANAVAISVYEGLRRAGALASARPGATAEAAPSATAALVDDGRVTSR